MDPATGESYLIEHPSEGVLVATFLYVVPPREGDGEGVSHWRFLADGREVSIAETAVLGFAPG